MMWGDHDGWQGGWLPMLLTMLAFWGLAAWAVMWIVRRSSTRAADAPRDHEDDAEAILRRRFACGEIDDGEYRARLKTLRGGPPTARPG